MADCGNAKGCNQAASPEPVLRQEIDRKYRRNDCATNVYSQNDFRWLDHLRHDIMHAEISDLPLGNHRLLAERGDGNVDVAAEERAKEQEEGGAGTYPQLHISKTQHPDLDQN